MNLNAIFIIALLIAGYCLGFNVADYKYKTAIIKATEENNAQFAEKNKLIAEKESELNYFKLKRYIEFKYIIKKIPDNLTCESLATAINTVIK